MLPPAGPSLASINVRNQLPTSDAIQNVLFGTRVRAQQVEFQIVSDIFARFDLLGTCMHCLTKVVADAVPGLFALVRSNDYFSYILSSLQ